MAVSHAYESTLFQTAISCFNLLISCFIRDLHFQKKARPKKIHSKSCNIKHCQVGYRV